MGGSMSCLNLDPDAATKSHTTTVPPDKDKQIQPISVVPTSKIDTKTDTSKTDTTPTTATSASTATSGTGSIKSTAPRRSHIPSQPSSRARGSVVELPPLHVDDNTKIIPHKRRSIAEPRRPSISISVAGTQGSSNANAIPPSPTHEPSPSISSFRNKQFERVTGSLSTPTNVSNSPALSSWRSSSVVQRPITPTAPAPSDGTSSQRRHYSIAGRLAIRETPATTTTDDDHDDLPTLGRGASADNGTSSQRKQSEISLHDAVLSREEKALVAAHPEAWSSIHIFPTHMMLCWAHYAGSKSATHMNSKQVMNLAHDSVKQFMREYREYVQQCDKKLVGKLLEKTIQDDIPYLLPGGSETEAIKQIHKYIFKELDTRHTGKISLTSWLVGWKRIHTKLFDFKYAKLGIERELPK